MENVGLSFEGGGICTAEITTVTHTMGVLGGHGVDSAALAIIFTACGHCTAITTAVGVVFVHTGICGVETITSHDLAGSGAATGALVVTCTGFEFSRCTRANAGLFDVSTGTCTEEITTQL